MAPLSLIRGNLKELQMENLSPGDLESYVEAFLRSAISNPGQKNLWFLLHSAECTDQITANRGESSAETRHSTGRGEVIHTSFPHESVCQIPQDVSFSFPSTPFCTNDTARRETRSLYRLKTNLQRSL
jgi:hypothetical protein